MKSTAVRESTKKADLRQVFMGSYVVTQLAYAWICGEVDVVWLNPIASIDIEHTDAIARVLLTVTEVALE